jgi:Mg2+-importing ATPase
VIIPLSPLGDVLGFSALPIAFWPLLIVIVAAYLVLVEMAKRRFEPRG